MAGKRLTVVISQSQGRNPAKRRLEEELAAALLMDRDVEVSLVPHLYDMAADHSGLLFLRGVSGPIVFLSWLYPRAARWTLDRQGVKGREGQSLLRAEEFDEDTEEAEAASEGIGPRGEVPNRLIWCLDLRAEDDPQVYLEEIQRIAGELATPTVGLSLSPNGSMFPAGSAEERRVAPYVETQKRLEGNGNGVSLEPEETRRRWYPVIDYSRCTNCMECIDFCLFGVYGIDHSGTILVEEQDSCKKGCPACSRVCPANAIIFPQHKTPAIAGASGEVMSLKIDLSKLFGGETADPLSLAIAERDTELVRDGRDAVGASVGIPKRQTEKSGPRDELDDLMDGLEEMDL